MSVGFSRRVPGSGGVAVHRLTFVPGLIFQPVHQGAFELTLFLDQFRPGDRILRQAFVSSVVLFEEPAARLRPVGANLASARRTGTQGRSEWRGKERRTRIRRERSGCRGYDLDA
jgi:hypothetical protein